MGPGRLLRAHRWRHRLRRGRLRGGRVEPVEPVQPQMRERVKGKADVAAAAPNAVFVVVVTTAAAVVVVAVVGGDQRR